jgi:hypothetical protein
MTRCVKIGRSALPLSRQASPADVVILTPKAMSPYAA